MENKLSVTANVLRSNSWESGNDVLLEGKGCRSFEIRQSDWSHAVQLAKHCNLIWTPALTVAPDGYHAGDWKGGYLKPKGQRVTQADACNFADALERAVEDLPDEIDLDVEVEYPWNPFIGREG